jgi:hypothetical protein
VFPLAVSAGEEVGKAILDKIVALKGDAYLKEKGGHIVELRGMVTLGVDIQRYQGWRNVLKPFLAKYPKVTVATHVAGFNAAKARKLSMPPFPGTAILSLESSQLTARWASVERFLRSNLRGCFPEG